MIIGKRRLAITNELRTQDAAIRIWAPPGYGKSVFAQLLRETGCRAPLHEQRTMREPRPGAGLIVGAADLAFDDEEIALVFSGAGCAETEIAGVRTLTEGWPAGVLYCLRLARLGVLQTAMQDLADPAFADLFEYIEQRIYRQATRAQRLRLLLGQVGFCAIPLVRAAMRALHADEIQHACLHRARGALRKSAYAQAAQWFIAGGRASDLQAHPRAWLTAAEQRLQDAGALAFVSEASSVAKALEQSGDAAACAKAILWLATAHARNGNMRAALVTCDRAGDDAAVNALRRELARNIQAHPPPKPSDPPALHIQLFHGRVVLGDREIRLAQREAAVLFSLAAHPARSIEARRLAEIIWPELDADQGRAALKVAVARLRGRLQQPGAIRAINGAYLLSADVRVDLQDVIEALESYEKDGDHSALWAQQGIFSSYCPSSVREAPWFARIEPALAQASHRLAQHLERVAVARGDARTLRRIGDALLSADFCNEDGCAMVARAYLMEGRDDLARAAYDQFAERLRAELGCKPSLQFEAIVTASTA